MSTKYIVCLAGMSAVLSLGCGQREERGGGHRDHGEHETSQEDRHERIVRISQEQQRFAGLKLAAPTRRGFASSIDAVGKFISDPPAVTHVLARKKSAVLDIAVSLGDFVEKESVLARLGSSNGSESQEITAPIAGLVVGRFAAAGETVGAGEAVLSIADISAMPCVLDVPEKESGRLRKGQIVHVRVPAYPDLRFSGRITYIAPRVDEETRSVKVRVEVPNPSGKLKFGMLASGAIVTATRKTLSVPEKAIQRLDGLPAVFVARNNEEFEPRKVVVGESQDGWVEILSGLDSKDKVVSDGSFLVKSEFLKESLSGDGHGH